MTRILDAAAESSARIVVHREILTTVYHFDFETFGPTEYEK
jgi:hypothetical protein